VAGVLGAVSRVALVGAALSLASGCGGSKHHGGSGDSGADQKPPPNIVVIMADDLGFGDVGAYAARFGTPSPAPTPNIDALAAEGLLFTQAHSSNGVCTPSRYGFLSGKYNWRSFVDISWDFAAPDIPSTDTTLPEFLKTQGYDTAAFGKWHLGGFFYDRAGVPYTARDNEIVDAASVDWEHRLDGHAVDNGFDRFRGLAVTINLTPYVYVKEDRVQVYDAGLGTYRDALNTDTFHAFTQDELNDGLTVGATGHAGLGDPTYRQADADPIMLAEVESYLAERANDPVPFFAYVAMYSPHLPWHTAPAFQGSAGFEYGDWMAEFDAKIGRVLDAIDANGLRENTLVVFTSDNGPEIDAFVNSRDNGRDSNGPLRGIKHDVWEGGTRVPFVVRWPGQVAAPGSVSDELIWHGDVFATIAAYLGAELPVDVAPDGESFLNVVRGQSKPSQRRDSIVVSSQYDHRAVITTGGWKLIDSTGGGGVDPSYDSANADIPDAFGVNQGTPKQLFYLPDDLGEDGNAIATITDVAAIRDSLTATTGSDLLGRLDQYRASFTSSIFPPFPDNDLDGLSNLEEQQSGTDPDNPDTDGDGYSDGDEVHARLTDPTSRDR
jgi:arylsulfatase A